MVAAEAVQNLLALTKLGGVINLFCLKARSAQSVDVISAVDPTMVVLAKYLGSLLWVGDSIILKGRIARVVNRRQHNTNTATAHYSIHLFERLMVTLHMLKQVVADDNVDAILLHRYTLHIKVHIGQRTLKVGSDISLRSCCVESLELTHQADLRGYVQYCRQIVESVVVVMHQVVPEQTVTLQR